MNGFAIAFGAIAATAVIINGIPQAVKIWRGNSDIGVNSAMWVLYLGLCCLGLGYGLRVANTTFVAANLGTMLTSSAVIVAIGRVRDERQWFVILRTASLGIVLVVLALLLPQIVVSVLIVAGSGLAWMQAFTSFQTWRRASDSEVSITTFALRFIALCGWAAQATITRDMTLMLISVISMCAIVSTVVFERLAARRRRVAMQVATPHA